MKNILNIFKSSETWSLIAAALLPVAVTLKLVPQEVASQGVTASIWYGGYRALSKIVKGKLPFLPLG